MRIGKRVFENYTFVMAIFNLTPDSFYPPSRKGEYDLLKGVENAVSEGAAVVDLGAQSTRPGYIEVSAEEELKRLLRPIELIKRNFDIPVSADTYFSRVADEALAAGAEMVNDVWGLTRDRDMASVLARRSASACIVHNSGEPLAGDPVREVKKFLESRVEFALSCGLEKDKICVDGGLGFAKDAKQNFALLERYEELNFGYPLLLGASRKSMFGGNAEDRLAPTLESTRLAARKGVLFVRVHDVKENVEAIKEVYENQHNGT